MLLRVPYSLNKFMAESSLLTRPWATGGPALFVLPFFLANTEMIPCSEQAPRPPDATRLTPQAFTLRTVPSGCTTSQPSQELIGVPLIPSSMTVTSE